MLVWKFGLHGIKGFRIWICLKFVLSSDSFVYLQNGCFKQNVFCYICKSNTSQTLQPWCVFGFCRRSVRKSIALRQKWVLLQCWNSHLRDYFDSPYLLLYAHAQKFTTFVHLKKKVLVLQNLQRLSVANNTTRMYDATGTRIAQVSVLLWLVRYLSYCRYRAPSIHF